MDGGHCSRVCQLNLRYGQIEDEVVATVVRVKTSGHFTKKMRNPRLRITATHVDNPLGKDRCVHRAIPPECLCKRRVTTRRRSDRCMWNTQNCRYGERLQCGRCQGLHYRVQITNIAGNMQGCDLPSAFAILVEASHETCDNERDVIHVNAKGNEVAVRRHLLGIAREIENSLLLLIG